MSIDEALKIALRCESYHTRRASNIADDPETEHERQYDLQMMYFFEVVVAALVKQKIKIDEQEFVAQIKSECKHNIRELEKRLNNQSIRDQYTEGFIEGQRRFDIDLLEKIEEWEGEYAP